MDLRRTNHIIVLIFAAFLFASLSLVLSSAASARGLNLENVPTAGAAVPANSGGPVRLSSSPVLLRSGGADGGAGPAFPKLPPDALAKIEPVLLKRIIEEGRATFIVYLRDQADLSAAARIKSLAERRLTVVETLQRTAERSQRDLLAFLDKQQIAGHAAEITPLWIFNGVAVTGDPQTLAAVARRDDVVKIRANRVWHLPEPVQEVADIARPQTLLWNIARIQADRVWDDLGITGQGVIVASMDTGVDWQHNALRDHYRGRDGDHNYDWFDFTETYPRAPADGHSHGTHTLGTIVGDGVDEHGQRLQIGVAPGAQWIAVKIFTDSGDTTNLWIHQAFQWLLAPTDLKGENPDPTKAPDIVNNSWGGVNGADDTFRPDVQALRAAGIVPVFAAGNEGDRGPGTVGQPASYPESIAVGATEPDPLVAPFSSRGPSFWGEMKPEFSAPGRSIRSSIPEDKYAVSSGTSMSTPHVAGSVALMLEAVRKASEQTAQTLNGVAAVPNSVEELQRAEPLPSVDDLEQLLALTAVDLGAPGPDNIAGAGRIDAYRATLWAQTAGKLYGFVRDGRTRAPIAQATVTGTSTANPEDRFMVRTQSDGEYSVAVPEGRYSIEVTAFGYESRTIRGVDVVAGFLSLRDIELDRKPTGTVAGQVRTVDGIPIQATIEVVDTSITAETDGKGTYSIDLPPGRYALRVAPAGYRAETAEVAVIAGERTVHNFLLTPAPATLFVDADQWTPDSVTQYYKLILDKAGIPFDTRPITTTESVPPVEELSAYDVVVWAHPWASPGEIDRRREDSATVDALTGYLEQGGRLLLTGQDIGWLDGGGNPSVSGALPYYEDYLHARYVEDRASRDSMITGSSDDVMAGIQLEFDTTYAYKRVDNEFSPDVIEPVDEMAQSIFQYDDGTGAGIKAQADNYRLVYLSFAADTTGPREELVDTFARAYAWLSRPVLTKSVDAPVAAPGARLTYTVTVENAIGVPLEGVTLVDPLPDEVDFIPDSATGGAVYNSERRAIEWSGNIPPRDSAIITFQVDLKEGLAGGSVVTNLARVRLDDVQLEAAASTRVLGPNLSQSQKTVDKEQVSSGETMTYTIELINSSPVVTATGASLVDPVPEQTQYIEGTLASGAVFDPDSREIRWSGDVPVAPPEDAPYTWIDSDMEGGPTFDWDTRAEEQGQPVADLVGEDDEISAQIPIGFTFPFFDQEFTAVRVSTNGFLSFTSTDAPFRNVSLPSDDAPGDLIAPFWDDFTLTSQGTIYTWSNGVDTLVVSWVEVPRYGGEELFTFQAILQANGEIVFQYRQLGSETESATIGIQNSDGSAGFNIAYNEPYAHADLAVLLRPPQPPVPPPVITFAVRVDEEATVGSVITNTAQVDDGHGQVMSLTATSRVGTTDLTRSRKTAPDVVLPGGTLTYTLEISNTGRLPANVTVTDPIPAKTQYRADSATGGATYDGDANAVQWAGEVLANQSHTLTFAVVVDPDAAVDTLITNTASVDDGVTEPFDLVATTKVIKPDLSRSAKFVDRREARSGDVLTYTVRVANNSPIPVPNVSMVDQVPEGLSLVPESLTGDAKYDPAENLIRWSGTLPPRGEGYVWDDSDMDGGPTFAWDDRAETQGVRVRDQEAIGDDTGVGPFPIGFAFPFFGGSFTEFYVSSNGFLSFEPITQSYFTNSELPNEGAPSNLIAPFWDDLNMRSGGEIYYWSDNVNTFVISWVNVPHFGQGGPYTFQAILRADGTILFQYREMDPNRLQEATIGVQGAAGTEGLTVAHDEPYIHDGLAVRIAPPTGKEEIQFQAKVEEDVAPERVLVNTAVIQDGLGNQIERHAKLKVNIVDLSGATMRAGTDQVSPGDRVTYRLTIPNTGTADATQTLVVNPLPESLAYVEGSATNGASYDPDQREIRWQGTVPAGEEIGFEYRADVLSPLADGDIISNTATISDGLHPEITRSADVQVVAPDLSGSEKRARAMVAQGDTLQYLVRIVNSGHAVAEVTFTDQLPAGVTYIEESAEADYGGPPSFDVDTRTIAWTGTVPARSIAVLRFSVLATADVGYITNVASIEDGLGATIRLEAPTRVVPYSFRLPVLLNLPVTD